MSKMTPATQDAVVVFAPSLILTITIEQGSAGAPELHLHAGGQGFWIARMAASLGANVTLSTALGGEAGQVLGGLLSREPIRLLSAPTRAANGAYVHDRRSGERRSIVDISGGPLSRHELDDLYSKTLMAALNSGTLVLAGSQGRTVASAVYRRLAKDARDNGVAVVADVAGQQLHDALSGGVTLLKISLSEVTALRPADTLEDQLAAIQQLHEQGARNVVLSRGQAGALALIDGRMLEVIGPRLTAADRHGTGDSMTAAAAVGIARGLPAADWLRLAASAGAVNAIRHGLGTGTRADIEQLVERMAIQPLDTHP